MSVQIDLAGRVALVTGGNKGIGKRIALGLARAGSSLAIAGRDRSALVETSKEIKQLGVQCQPIPCDVSSVTDIEMLVQQAKEEFKHIDILVNCAGTSILEPSDRVSEENWDKVIDINLKGEFFCASRVGREMINEKFGSIINIASEEGIVGVAEHAAYGASKAGIIHLTKVLALEWGKYGIRVNCIAPAAVRTSMNETYWLNDDTKYSWVLNRIALKRVCEPDEIVGAALFLASDLSTFVTGHVLVVDGGITAGMP